MQQRSRTAHSQQPQAREQPAPRAARPGPTRHHPGAGARQLPLAHSLLGSSLGPLGSRVRRDQMRGRVTKDSPWGQRLKGTGTLAPQLLPRRERGRSWEDKGSLCGRHSCRRNSGQIPVGAQFSPPPPDSGELLQTIRPEATARWISSSRPRVLSLAPTRGRKADV